MSVYTTAFVYCDGPEDECTSTNEAWPTPVDYLTVGELRAMMKTHGWKTVNGKDYCPTCVKDGLHKTPTTTQEQTDE